MSESDIPQSNFLVFQAEKALAQATARSTKNLSAPPVPTTESKKSKLASRSDSSKSNSSYVQLPTTASTSNQPTANAATISTTPTSSTTTVSKASPKKGGANAVASDNNAGSSILAKTTPSKPGLTAAAHDMPVSAPTSSHPEPGTHQPSSPTQAPTAATAKVPTVKPAAQITHSASEQQITHSPRESAQLMGFVDILRSLADKGVLIDCKIPHVVFLDNGRGKLQLLYHDSSRLVKQKVKIDSKYLIDKVIGRSDEKSRKGSSTESEKTGEINTSDGSSFVAILNSTDASRRLLTLDEYKHLVAGDGVELRTPGVYVQNLLYPRAADEVFVCDYEQSVPSSSTDSSGGSSASPSFGIRDQNGQVKNSTAGASSLPEEARAKIADIASQVMEAHQDKPANRCIVDFGVDPNTSKPFLMSMRIVADSRG